MSNWADDLIVEYEQGREGLREMKKVLSDTEYDKLDKRQINSMIRTMSFSIDWMKTGKEPGNLRGIDRRSIHQRRVLMDMELFPSLEIYPEDKELTEDDKQILINILSTLSARERQCFILHNAYQMSMNEVGKELNISKSAVQTFLERANKKVKNKMLSYDCRTVAN